MRRSAAAREWRVSNLAPWSWTTHSDGCRGNRQCRHDDGVAVHWVDRDLLPCARDLWYNSGRAWTETWTLPERTGQRRSEIIFEVTEDEVDRGCSAGAIGYGVHTQGASTEQIRRNAREAVDCYFDEPMERSGIIRLILCAMKSLPREVARNVSGRRLAAALGRLGYVDRHVASELHLTAAARSPGI